MIQNRLEKIIIIILVIFSSGFIINALVTKSALKDIEVKIDQTSEDLKNVSKNVGKVIYSLENSTQNIDTILASIEKSKKLLNDLSQKTGVLTRSEKVLIAESIEGLEKTKTNIQKDKDEANELIDMLNKTISNE